MCNWSLNRTYWKKDNEPESEKNDEKENLFGERFND